MTGGITAAGVLAAAAVASVGVSAYELSQQGGISGQLQGQSGTVFGEQQYYAQQLQQLIANPSSVKSLPNYQFNLDQGAQAVARQMAGSGFLGSWKEAIALTKYGQDYATNVYATQAALLGQFAGLSSPVNPTQSLIGASGAASQGNQSLQQLLASLTFAGRSGIFGSGGGGGMPTNYDGSTTFTPPPSFNAAPGTGFGGTFG